MARILIHSLIFKPDGVSTAYLYADLVSELLKKGHELQVLTTTPHYNIIDAHLSQQPLRKRWGGLFHESTFEKKVKVYHIPMTKSANTLKRIFDFVRFHVLSIGLGLSIKKFDIVLSPSPPLTIGIVSWLLAAIRGGKAIYNVQEIYPDLAINQGVIRNKWIIYVLKWLERLVYNKSAAVVTIDEKFSDVIAPRFKDISKLHVIPNFVDTDLYEPMEKDNVFSRQYNLVDKFVVCYAGNIGHAQDWEPIVHAAKALQNLPIVFLIVGDGVKKQWLKDAIRAGNVTNILLLDYQPRELMPVINASADIHTIVMHKNVSQDGFPSKIYTIMASARSAVVASGENSPLYSFMKNAGFGEVVPLGDKDRYTEAIRQAYLSRKSVSADGKRARDFILENYSKAVIGNKYHTLIVKYI